MALNFQRNVYLRFFFNILKVKTSSPLKRLLAVQRDNTQQEEKIQRKRFQQNFPWHDTSPYIGKEVRAQGDCSGLELFTNESSAR